MHFVRLTDFSDYKFCHAIDPKITTNLITYQQRTMLDEQLLSTILTTAHVFLHEEEEEPEKLRHFC